MNVDLNLLGWGGDVIVWGGVLTEQARSELVDRRVAVLCRKDLRYEQFEGVGVVKLDVGGGRWSFRGLRRTVATCEALLRGRPRSFAKTRSFRS